MKGTNLFIKALQCEGVEKIFGYPGSYVIDIFDEIYKQDKIELILPRHEQGLVHEADGYARSTGKVGVCLATSGPGATNLVTGIATANYDSVPLVCFTGQVPTSLIGNDAFQEVDIIGITRSICKYGVTVRDRKDLGRIIKEAFYIARTGRPGPVIVDLPKDIMLEDGEDSYPEQVKIRGYRPSTGVHSGQVKKAMEILEASKKPLFLIGGGVIISGAGSELTSLAEKTQIPVVTTIMGKGSIPAGHPYYIGNIGMHGSYAANKAVNECDVLFSIGTRFNDRITAKISEFAKNAKIIHVDIDAASISRNIVVDIPIVADAKLAIEKFMEEAKALDTKQWIAQIDEWKEEGKEAGGRQENKEAGDRGESEEVSNRKESEEASDRRESEEAGDGRKSVEAGGRLEGLTPENIFKQINAAFQDAIFVTDVGQHQMWTMQNLEMDSNKKLLTSGGLGTMGYGFPAAIGAKLGNPDRQVVCITGDGGFQMNIQEMATAITQELPIIICLFNNGFLGMVRQWQQLFYGRRYAGTCLRYRKSCLKNCNDETKECPPYAPDFVKLAESYGAYGIRVTKEEQIKTALQQAAENKSAPTIIEFILDSEELVLPMVKSGSSLSNMIMDIN